MKNGRWDYFKRLNDKIEWNDKDKTLDIDELNRRPRKMTEEWLTLYDSMAARDPYRFSKLLYQVYKVDSRHLYNILIRAERMINRPLEDLYKAGLAIDKDFTPYSKMKADVEKLLMRELKKYYKKEELINEGIYEKRNAIKTFIENNISNVQKKAYLLNRLDLYERLHDHKIHYVTHDVFGRKGNRKIFSGVMIDLLKGRAPKGKMTVDPYPREMTDRKMPTFAELTKAGYTYETNTNRIWTTSLQYVMSRSANMQWVQCLKQDFMGRFNTAYELSMRQNGSEARWKQMLAFFEDQGGFFYVPTKDEFSGIKNKITRLKKDQKALGLTKMLIKKDRLKYEELGAEIRLHELRQEQMKKMLSVYEGTDKNFGENGTYLRETLANAISVIGEKFIPMNYVSYVKMNKEKMQLMFKSVEKAFDTFLMGKKYKETNLAGWEGVFINSTLHSAMSNLVFRDAYLNRSYEYEFQNIAWKALDKFNAARKSLAFWKFGLMAAQDAVMALACNPTFISNLVYGIVGSRIKFETNKVSEYEKMMKEYSSLLSVAGKDPLKKPELNVAKQKLIDYINKNPSVGYLVANRKDLFSKAITYDVIFSDAMKSSIDMINKSNGFGRLIDTLVGEKNFVKKLFAGWYDKTREAGNVLTKAFASAKYAWGVYQTASWSLDEVVRLSLFKTQFNRFAKVNDIDKAAFYAAENVNLWLAHYTRVPAATRQMMNRIFFVPTYRMQMARLYKEMVKGAIASLTFGHSEKISDFLERKTGIQISESSFGVISHNRLRQAAHLMAPLFMKFGLTTAVKSALALWFGYNFGDLFEMITNYRYRKNKGLKSMFDEDIEVLTLGTPLFEIEKYVTRSWWTTFKYNLAAFPGTAIALIKNEDILRGKKIYSDAWKEGGLRGKTKFMGEVTLWMLNTFFPMYSEYKEWSKDDLGVFKKLFNTSGLGYFYKIEDPNYLMREFEKSISEASTEDERLKAQKNFDYGFRSLYKKLRGEEFKTLQQQIDEIKKGHVRTSPID